MLSDGQYEPSVFRKVANYYLTIWPTTHFLILIGSPAVSIAEVLIPSPMEPDYLAGGPTDPTARSPRVCKQRCQGAGRNGDHRPVGDLRKKPYCGAAEYSRVSGVMISLLFFLPQKKMPEILSRQKMMQMSINVVSQTLQCSCHAEVQWYVYSG